MRGYAAIAVDRPKREVNVGGVIRAAQIFSASLVVLGTPRYQHQGSDAMKGYRHLPVLTVHEVMDCIPFDCVPVAVELIEGAVNLAEYTHPERAFYVFGGEDCTLGRRILDRCRDVVKIPSSMSLNLAACVNVVLYDRQTKRGTP